MFFKVKRNKKWEGELIHPEDSKEWAHAVHKVSTLNIQIFLLSVLFIIIAISFSLPDVILPKDNFNDVLMAFRSEFTNSTIVRLDEVIQALDPSHILHKIHTRNLYRYFYGTTWKNHCYLFPYPAGTNFPSLIRKMTFSSLTQASLRTAILVGVTIRMLCVICRGADIIEQVNCRTTRCLAKICLILDMLTWILGMFFCALHVEQDANAFGLLVIYSLPLFGISFMFSGFTYTLLERYDQHKKSKRLLERLFCLVLFMCCFPFVSRDFISFLLTKPCMYYVPIEIALCEYICIISIVVFYGTQIDDFYHLEWVLSTEKSDTMSCMNHINTDVYPDYMPAVLYDYDKSKEAEDNDKKKHKSVIFIW